MIVDKRDAFRIENKDVNMMCRKKAEANTIGTTGIDSRWGDGDGDCWGGQST